jgi:predicted transposase YdaD
MQYPGLLPFAALGKTDNPERTLRDAVRAMGRLPDREQRHEILGAAYLLSGLVLNQAMIGKIIRRDNMRESATYQAVLEEGREEGDRQRQKTVAINLLREGLAIEVIARVSELSIEAVTQLQQENHL